MAVTPKVRIAGLCAQIILDFLNRHERELWLSPQTVRDLERLAQENLQNDVL